MNKKALSNIIATVLIVLLALAAVAIVWSVISNMIGETSQEITLTNLCVQSEVKPIACINATDTNGANVTMQYVRGDSVVGMKAVVTYAGGTNINSNDTTSMPSLKGTAIVTVGGVSPESATAVAIVSDGTNTKVCEESPVRIPCA